MSNFSDIKGLFAPDMIVSHLKNLPTIETPVMDTIFSDRVMLPFPVVSKEEMEAVVHELPVIRRGGHAISAIPSNGVEVTTIEPLPVRMSEYLTARDVLDLKTLTGKSKDLWVKNKIDLMRRAYRKTVEGICAVSLNGKIEWPVALTGGGFDNYTVDYGTPETVSVDTMWNSEGSTIKDVFKSLKEMKKVLKKYGYGTNIEVWAGEVAYETLYGMADSHPAKSSIPITIDEAFIDISGFKVKDRSETFRNPETKSATPIIGDNDIIMISKDAGHKLVYCAVDDFDANLQAVPLFVKLVKTSEPSAISLIAEGKPLPIVNVKGICKATVVAA